MIPIAITAATSKPTAASKTMPRISLLLRTYDLDLVEGYPDDLPLDGEDRTNLPAARDVTEHRPPLSDAPVAEA